VRILIDTSVIVRAAQPGTQAYGEAQDALANLRLSGFEPCLVPQVFYEFWVVATRPLPENGLGFTTAQAQTDIEKLQRLFTVLRDERAIFEHWQELVAKHDVKGKNAHDARLVAAMKRHELTHLLTFNLVDFTRFSDISVLTPTQVVTHS